MSLKADPQLFQYPQTFFLPHFLSLSHSLSLSFSSFSLHLFLPSLFNAHTSTIKNKYDFWLNITLFASSVVFSYLVPHFSGFVVKLCIKVNVKTRKICNLLGAPFYSLLQWRLRATVREPGMCSAWMFATQQGSTKPLSLFSQDETLDRFAQITHLTLKLSCLCFNLKAVKCTYIVTS